jgi:hypothetical protein
MTKFWINVSPITGAVYIGRPNKKGTERLEKEEVKWFDSIMADYLSMKFRDLKTDKLNLSLWKWVNITLKLVVEWDVVAS